MLLKLPPSPSVPTGWREYFIEKGIKRMFHKEFADSIKDVRESLDRLDKIEARKKAEEKIIYRSVEEMEKAGISRKFSKKFDDDISELKARLDRMKRMQ